MLRGVGVLYELVGFLIVYVILGIIYATAEMYQYRSLLREMREDTWGIEWCFIVALLFLIAVAGWPVMTLVEKVFSAKES